jgi:micrococcal nuclease
MVKSHRVSSRRNRWINHAILITVVIIILVGFRLVDEIGRDKTPADRFVVARVIDGDTFELAGGDRVRLLGIDTPEKGEPFADRATFFLDSLALGKPVRLEFAENRRDSYGRLLGYAYIDSVFVNKAILDNGLGYWYLFKDNESQRLEVKELLAAQRAALARRAGIWSVAHDPEPAYINVEGSFRFHRPGCRSVQKLKPGHYQEFKTREEALALGLSPCRNCKP